MNRNKMLKFKGVIFDVDDTILDNRPGVLGRGLHERSRLEALRIVGEELAIKELSEITLQENVDAFVNASTHSLEGTVWSLLHLKGLVVGDRLEEKNDLLMKIVRVKNEIHERILIEEAEEVPGAIAFITDLAAAGLRDKMAIASSAIRRDIDLFFTKTGLDQFFPSERIMSKESFGHTKPHPEVFNMAFMTLGLPDKDRKRVLAFEDDPRGIMSAVAAGLSVCGITRRYSREKLTGLEIPPDFIIDNYEEARAVVGL